MPKRVSGNEELINHYGLVRLRVIGSGSLQLRLLSLDEVNTTTLSPITMADPTDIEPTRLSNLTTQRCSLELKTTAINETFRCSKIIIFAKPTAASYPER
jgi:hypothetical protein